MFINVTGHVTLDIAKLSDLGPIAAVGQMELKVVFEGYDEDSI